MTFSFKTAKREGVHLIIGLMGGTGSGKTYSAFALAAAMSGGKRFACIDTEAGRALHYADQFAFDHGDLCAPFRPGRYLEAIQAADTAGYPVIIVDSMSHEHAGEGGLLDWHEEEMRGSEARNIIAWSKPKMAHKEMVQKLLQLRAHLILCFRAEPKIKIEKGSDGKNKIIDAGWQPICAKGIEFELTCSFLLSHEKPGMPTHPIKLPAQLRKYFPDDKPIGEFAGRGLVEWAGGGQSIVERMKTASTMQDLEELAAAAKSLEGDERDAAKDAWKASKARLQPAMGVV